MAFFSGLTWYQRIPLGRPLTHIEGDQNVQNMIDIADTIVVGPGVGNLSIQQFCTTSQAFGEFSIALGDNNFTFGDFSTIIGGRDNLILAGISGSTILGCNNLTATTSDTLYVCNLNIGGNTIVDDLSAGTTNVTIINISGDTNIGGDTIISGATSISGPTTINNFLDISGDTTVGGNLLVSGSTEILGPLSACNGAFVSVIEPCGTDINLSGDTNISNDLTVSGNTTLEQDLTVNGDTNLNQNLNVSGDTTISGNTEILGDLSACTDVYLSNIIACGDDINITADDVIFSNDVEITNDLNVSGNTEVLGDLSACTTAYLNEIEDCGSGITINSDVTINGSLSANTLFASGLTLDDLIVSGDTNLLGNVSACTTIYLNEIEACDDNNVTIIDGLVVSASTTVGNNLTVEGDTSLTNYVTTSTTPVNLPVGILSAFTFDDVNRLPNSPLFTATTTSSISIPCLTGSTNLLNVDGGISATTGVYTDYIHGESVLNLNNIISIDNELKEHYQGERVPVFPATVGDDYFFTGGTVTVNGNLFMIPGTIIRTEKVASFSPLNLNGLIFVDDDTEEVTIVGDTIITSGNTLAVNEINGNDDAPIIINNILTVDGSGGTDTVSVDGDLQVTGDTFIDGGLILTSGACITGDTKLTGTLTIDGHIDIVGDAFLFTETVTACTGIWASTFVECVPGEGFEFLGGVTASTLEVGDINAGDINAGDIIGGNISVTGITIEGGEIFTLFDDRYLFKTGDTVTSGGTLISPFLSAGTTTTDTVNATDINTSNDLGVSGFTTLENTLINGTLSACTGPLYLDNIVPCDGILDISGSIDVSNEIISGGTELHDIFTTIVDFTGHTSQTGVTNPHAISLSALTDFYPGAVGAVEDGELIGYLDSISGWTNVDLSYICSKIPDFEALLTGHTANTSNPHQTSLEDLIDTDTTGVTTNDVIIYSAGTWVSSNINALVNDTDNFVSGGTFNVTTSDIDFTGTDGTTTFSVGLDAITNDIDAISACCDNNTADIATVSGDVITLSGDFDTHVTEFNTHTGDTNNPHQTSLTGLTDTNVGILTNGQVLTYIGGEWVNTFAGAGGDTFVLSGGTVFGDVILTENFEVSGDTVLNGVTANTIDVDDITINGSLSACNDTVYFNEIDSCDPSGITINSNVVIPSASTLTACAGVKLNTIEHCDGSGGTITVVGDLEFGNVPGGIGASIFKSWGEFYFDENDSETTIDGGPGLKDAIVALNPTKTYSGFTNNFVLGTKEVTIGAFTNTGATLTYTGETTQLFHITVAIAAEIALVDGTFRFYITRNSVELDNIKIPSRMLADTLTSVSLNGVTPLDPGDEISLYVNNASGFAINVTHGNITVAQI